MATGLDGSGEKYVGIMYGRNDGITNDDRVAFFVDSSGNIPPVTATVFLKKGESLWLIGRTVNTAYTPYFCFSMN